MNEPRPSESSWSPDPFRQKPSKDRIWLHVLLFVLTLASTTISYVLWVGTGAGEWSDLYSAEFLGQAIWFSVPLLLFLTVHEFGHYIAARIHRVDATLPFYIPLPFIGIGTLGAVIRIREAIPSLRKLFDIGVAGPLAGFVAVFVMLILAFATLPDVDHVQNFAGHDSLKSYVADHGAFPPELIREADAPVGAVPVVGGTLLYSFVAQFFENAPPMYEMYHYPFLFACWLGLFFTALNLLPVGQLDGGHVLLALVGQKWHARIARLFVVLLLVSGSIGYGALDPEVFASYDFLRWPLLAGMLYVVLNKIFDRDHNQTAPVLLALFALGFCTANYWPGLASIGYLGWFVWSFLIAFVIRVDHPPVLYTEPLTPTQRVLSVAAIVIFVICFSFRPFYYV